MSLLAQKEEEKNETETVVVCPYCGGINTIKHNEEVSPGYNSEKCTQCSHVEFCCCWTVSVYDTCTQCGHVESHNFGVVQTKEKGD